MQGRKSEHANPGDLFLTILPAAFSVFSIIWPQAVLSVLPLVLGSLLLVDGVGKLPLAVAGLRDQLPEMIPLMLSSLLPILLGAVIVGDDDRIYVGEVYMYRSSQYLEACPKAEFLVWKGKEGYSLRVEAEGRITEGPEFDRLSEVLGRKNMHVNALWVFRPSEVWDESASYTSGDRVARWTSPAPAN